jgi:hypothetical protein
LRMAADTFSTTLQAVSSPAMSRSTACEEISRLRWRRVRRLRLAETAHCWPKKNQKVSVAFDFLSSNPLLMCTGDPHMTPGLHASHSDSTLDTGSRDDRDRGLHHLQITRTPSKTIISFRPSDPEHPNNWSTVRTPSLYTTPKLSFSAEMEIHRRSGLYHVGH